MPKIMYSDEDGTASKESEAIYWDRTRTICSLNSLLSLLGVGAFTLSGEYAKEHKSCNQPIFFAKVLWASSSLRTVPIFLETAANLLSSLFCYSIAFVYIGLIAQSSYIPLVSGGRYYLLLLF